MLRSFSLFNREYSIERKDISEEYRGYLMYDNAKVYISNEVSTIEEEELVAWHEIVHAALLALGYEELSDNEQFVTSFANALHQAITTLS